VLEYLPDHDELEDSLRVIRVADFRKRHTIRLVMDGEAGKAAAYLLEEEA
jgi:hypothetical protein